MSRSYSSPMVSKMNPGGQVVMGPSVTILSTLTGEEPSRAIGATFKGTIEK